MTARPTLRAKRALPALLGAALLLGACAEPTVEEIRDQAQSDLTALLRHAATAMDDAQNRAALNDSVARVANLLGDKGSVDIFEGAEFKKEIEHLVVELEARTPKLFTEQNVIADIDDGKRFRFAASELCKIFSDSDCNDPKLAKVELDFDVTLDGDTVHIGLALAGKTKIGTVSINRDRLRVAIDGAKALTFLNDLNARIGETPIEVRQLAGSWRFDISRHGTGLKVEAALDKALLEQDIEVLLDQPPTIPGQPIPEPKVRVALLSVDIPEASVMATLADGKAQVSSTLEARRVQLPMEERDATIVGKVEATLSGSTGGVLKLVAQSDTPLNLSVDNKTALQITLDRDNRALEVSLEPRGSDTVLVLGPAVKPRVELHPEVFDGGGQPLADAVVEGDLSAGLTVLPRDGDAFLEVLQGTAQLRSGGKTLTLTQGQCMSAVEAKDPQNFLDFMSAGSCQ